MNDAKDENSRCAPCTPHVWAEQPGGLRSEAKMTLQTRNAHKLVIGRRRSKGVEPIVGMLDFGRRMKMIWLAARNDDPYADWILWRIEESIDQARSLMQEKKDLLNRVLEGVEGFNITIAHSLEPVTVPIQFSNPYGYMGVYLVADFDHLSCALFTARHIGLIDRKQAEKFLSDAGRAIRRTYHFVSQWKYTGVDRGDLQQMNQNAQRAMDLMGPVPEEFLTLQTRARHAPDIKQISGRFEDMVSGNQ